MHCSLAGPKGSIELAADYRLTVTTLLVKFIACSCSKCRNNIRKQTKKYRGKMRRFLLVPCFPFISFFPPFIHCSFFLPFILSFILSFFLFFLFALSPCFHFRFIFYFCLFPPRSPRTEAGARKTETSEVDLGREDWMSDPVAVIQTSVRPTQQHFINALRGSGPLQTSGADNIKTLELTFLACVHGVTAIGRPRA